MRKWIACVLVGALMVAAVPAVAQGTFPSRPMHMVVSYPPGGATDIMARLVATRLQDSWGQPVVVDNRPGANGNIGADIAAKSAPDGHTLFVNTSSHAIGANLYRKLSYDLQRDFTGITLLASVPNLLVVSNELPIKDVKELIAYARANPEKLNFGSAGTGSNAHLSMELFGSMTGTRFTHIPYKGNTGILADLIAGNIAFTIDSLPPYLPMVKAGKIRALALSTSKRSTAMPELLTIAESGVPGYEAVAWFGLSAPVGTPKEVLRKISAETVRILRLPDVITRLAELGAEPGGGTPEQFDAHVKSELEKFARIIREAKVELQ